MICWTVVELKEELEIVVRYTNTQSLGKTAVFIFRCKQVFGTFSMLFGVYRQPQNIKILKPMFLRAYDTMVENEDTFGS